MIELYLYKVVVDDAPQMVAGVQKAETRQHVRKPATQIYNSQ